MNTAEDMLATALTAKHNRWKPAFASKMALHGGALTNEHVDIASIAANDPEGVRLLIFAGLEAILDEDARALAADGLDTTSSFGVSPEALANTLLVGLALIEKHPGLRYEVES